MQDIIKNKKRIEINLDKHTYDFIKSKKINASKLIRQLLRVALFSGSTDYIPYTNYTQSQSLGKDEVASSNLAWSLSFFAKKLPLYRKLLLKSFHYIVNFLLKLSSYTSTKMHQIVLLYKYYLKYYRILYIYEKKQV